MNSSVSIFFLFFLVTWTISAQHTPPIQNFKPSEYKAHNQNWSVTQDSSGILYFASTDGLLSYNGTEWKLNRLNKNQIIRAVCAVDDRIYSGSYGEIGFWTRGKCKELIYTSLNEKVPENAIAKEEIWHILSVKNKIYFQSFSVLLVYDGTTIQNIPLPGNIMFLQNANDHLYFQSLDFGIYEVMNNLTLRLLPGTDFFNKKTVTGITSFSTGDLIISTSSHGIFTYKNKKIQPWNPALIQYFSEIQINKLLVNKNDQLFLCTIRDGLLIFKKDGNLQYHINTTNGLQNNTVLAIYEDITNNIWLGLDKGISLINIENDHMVYYDHKGNLGTVYTSALFDSILYLGTNQGVYYYDQRKKNNPAAHLDFTLVKGTQGQVWQLKSLDSGVLCGHNDGSFIINKKKCH